MIRKHLNKALNTFLVILTFPISAIQAHETNPSPPPKAKQDFIEHPDNHRNKIEFFTLKPDGDGPFPIIFLPVANHPKGAKALVEFGYLDRFVNLGIACVAISAPGFGASDGQADFSGPYSKETIIAVIEYCKNLSFVDSSRMGIYGMNRNATLASLVSAACPDLTLQILESGEYDLTSRRENFPGYLKALGLHESFMRENGISDAALIDRSSLFLTSGMSQTTLILHGEFDNHYGLPSAKALHEKLIEQGVQAYLKIYPNGLHDLTPEKWEDITPFLREHFFELTGIGIQVTQIGPVIQVAKLHDKMLNCNLQKLKVGDTILGISPDNNDTWIDAIKMTPKEFISHVLGAKGTTLRLRVQRFDYAIEEIILERRSYMP